MAKTFTFFTDPSHGWLKVPVKELFELGIDKTQFTAYSYVRSNAVYLEEDSDASKFLKLYEHIKKTKPKLSYKHSNRYSRIRSYDSLKVSN